MTSGRGPVQAIALGSASGKRELFMVWIRICMYAAVASFGSGSSFDWTSRMNAELTAENRPAWVRFRVSVQYRGEGGQEPDNSRK